MAKAAFLVNDLSRTATITIASQAVPGLGWDMLRDPQPRHRARVNNAGLSFVMDFGAVVQIDCMALIGTSLTEAARVIISASETDPQGLINAYIPYGEIVGAASPDWNGNVVITLDNDLGGLLSVRYLRWFVADSSGPIDIGLAPVGKLFRPSRNFAFGATEGRNDASIRDINPDTRAEFGIALPQQRVKTVTFPALTKAEARGDLDQMDRICGAAGDVLFIEDPAASHADRSRDSIWGSFRKSGADAVATRSAVNMFGRQFVLTERL